MRLEELHIFYSLNIYTLHALKIKLANTLAVLFILIIPLERKRYIKFSH